MSIAVDPVVVQHVTAVAEGARWAARRLALLSRAEKDAALLHLADAVEAATPQILAGNAEDIERGRASGMSESLQDRLRLDETRVAAVAQALRDVAALPDPVGEIVRGSTLANGLQIRQVRVPMGVIGMIYEARPNVTVDAAGLCLKSGNAVILRGGSAAASSNHALVEAMRGSLAAQGLPRGCHQPAGRGRARRRTGPDDGTRATSTSSSRVGEPTSSRPWSASPPCPSSRPASASATSTSTAPPTSTRRRRSRSTPRPTGPSVCNAAESLLVHRDVAADFLPKALDRPRGRRCATARGARGRRPTPRRPARHTTSRASRTSAPSGTASR